MKNTFTFILFFTWLISSSGQSLSLENKLQGKINLEEIMTTVNMHYEAIDDGTIKRTSEPNIKHWVRWAHYMSSRTDEKGDLTNVAEKISEALQLVDRYSGSRTSTGNWSFLGPKTIISNNSTNSSVGIGRVDRIAFHPTNANIMYIGTSGGGLYKSLNAGTSWNPVTSTLPSTGVSGVVVSHGNPNTVYILTGDGDSNIGGLVERYGYMRYSSGAYVSNDGGSTWRKLGDLPILGQYVGYQLVQDPNNPSVLIAATSEGIFRTTNAGQTWTISSTLRTYELKFMPGSSSVVYATQRGRFLRSTNGGVSFNMVNTTPTLPNERVALAVTESVPGNVYLLSGGGTNGSTYGGIYFSINSGVSFTQMSNTPNVVTRACNGDGSGGDQSRYDLALGVSHSSPGTLVTGAIRVWSSLNFGINMTVRSPQCGASTGTVHDDIHDVEYNPLTNEVFVCSDGGVHKSSDHGVTWTNASNGISASQIYHMAGSNVSLDNMIIGLQDNGIKSRDNNTNAWNHRSGADGYDCIYRNNSSTQGYWTINRSVRSFSDNGATVVTGITPTLPNGPEWFGRLSRAQNDGDIVLAGYSDIMRSTNAGASWSNRGANGNWDIEFCPSNSSRFYAVGGDAAVSNENREFYRSDDVGVSWTLLNPSAIPPASQNLKVTDIGVRRNLSTNVWLVYGGFSNGQKVYFSNDAGVTFINMSGSLPNVPVNCIVVDALNNAYIGADIGVFYRGVNMTDWVPYWNNLPLAPVTDLELYPSDDIIRASTFGKGVYESDLYSSCLLNLPLTSSISGNRLYEAGFELTSTSNIFGGAKTNVLMKSARRVVLKPGFSAPSHNKFRSYIDPCGVYDLE